MKKFAALFTAFILIIANTCYAIECRYAIKPELDSGKAFANEVTLVYKDGKSAVVDIFGNYIIEFDERTKLVRSNGLIMIVGENDMAAFFYKNGEQLTDYIYDTFPVTDEKWGTKEYKLYIPLKKVTEKASLYHFPEIRNTDT